ncbi:MAG: SpoIIE family protein phosphatase [Candidatus Zixiibacteriota bacterium]|nr:MAG: SpoIIE family protein phosphatase [candidate division Zixibacteria bacterium]
MYRLVGTDGGRYYSWSIQPGEHTIGRGKGADFVVADGTVSKNHAVIALAADGEKLYVIDQGSKNGTLVNGVRITERTELKERDSVIFGQAEFRICVGDEGAVASSSMGTPQTTRLAENDPEKSVFLSINEALQPLPSKVADLPQVLPTLFEMAKMLVLPGPQEEMLGNALGLVNKVIPAERLAILTRAEEGDELITKGCVLPGGKDPGGFSLSRTVAEEILNQKSSMLIDPHDDPRFARQESIIRSDIGSAMAVPLFDGGVVLGILYVDTTNPLHRYNNDYLRLLATFGNLIASRLLNYELMRERQEKEVFAAELRRASMIQRNLLTKKIPELEGYKIHAFQEQCRMVGGDLYDMARLPDGRLVFVVADVSGKGMGGALLMANILASFRILYEDSSFALCRILKQVSQQLFNYSAPEDFATVFVGVIDPVKHELCFVNAGHNPALLVRRDGTLTLLEASGTMIGAFVFSDWQEETVRLESGDLVFVFSDGVVEADKDGKHYGDERLERFVRSHREDAPAALVDHIMSDIMEFAAGSARSDDITMLAVKRD